MHSETRTFLETLWPSIPDGHFLLFWSTPPHLSTWSQTINIDLSKLIQTANLYIGCASHLEVEAGNGRGTKESCAAIPAVWLDIDYGKGHKKPNLPQTEEEAMRLIHAMGLPPTMVVHSGRGLQAWWCLREPYLCETEADRNTVERVTMGWCNRLRVISRERGWDADQVGDITRVMRLPGTYNRKGALPVPTVLQSCDPSIRYNLSDFDNLIPSDFTVEKKTEGQPLVFTVRQDGNPPTEKFTALMQRNIKFKRGWERDERVPITDKSASGYDYYMATLAFADGWSPQEVVDLLVAMRRKHGDDLHLQHHVKWSNTIHGAYMFIRDAQEKRRVSAEVGARQLGASNSTDHAEILAACSSMIGVKIEKFVRFLGEPRTYRMIVNGCAVNIDSVDKLASQAGFQRVILDSANVLFDTMKRKDWGVFCNTLFRAVVDVELSEEATVEGSYRTFLLEFLSSGVSQSDDWRSLVHGHQAFMKDGRIYFRMGVFKRNMSSGQGEKVSQRQLVTEMSKLGCKQRSLSYREKGANGVSEVKCVSVWMVPQSIQGEINKIHE